MQPQEEQDKRYRVLVLLQRSDRPRYYDFHCPQCQMKVCELSGSDVVAMQDVLDTSGLPLVGVRCDGRFQGGYCRTYYYFSLNDRAPRVTATITSVTITPVVSPK